MVTVCQMGSGHFAVTACLLLWVSLATTVEGSSPHPCNRVCEGSQAPMSCEYNFTVEWYLTLSKACWNCPFNLTDCFRPQCVSGDGHRRPVITVNRQIPGPAIEVCEGDRVVVWVRNELSDGATTSLHWHGMHQRGTPYMDGTAHITQCPIQPFETFRYEFTASPAGTHWYHSHTSLQFGDGLSGPIIVRQPSSVDPHSALYDEDQSEHVVVISDWMPVTSHDRFLNLMHYAYFMGDMSALINGRSRLFEVRDIYNLTRSRQTAKARTPMSTFRVERNKRYRFRIISVSQKCPFRLFFDSHVFHIIATDGVPMSPVTVDSIMIGPGERYDVVVSTDQPVANYWIRAIGLRDCWYTNGTANAILKYEGAGDEDPDGDPLTYTKGTMFGPFPDPRRSVYYGDGFPTVSVPEVNSSQTFDLTHQTPDVKHFISMSFLNNDNTIFNNGELYPVKSLPRRLTHFTPTMNNITFRMPPVPLLSQPEDVPESWFCNRDTIVNMSHCLDDLCRCVHRLHVQTGQVVEVIMVVPDKDGEGHPMHLHGYNFHVLAMAPFAAPFTLEHVEDMDRQGSLPRKLINPPLKDTIHIPNRHYAIIRFRADNPGIWFFHCHIETHLAQGKAIVLQVGDRSEFPPVPDGFPRCGSFGIKNTDKRGNSDQDRRTCSNRSVRAALSFWGAFVLICAQSAFELI